MTTPDRHEHQLPSALVDLGRRLVGASAELPREALRFLGTPTVARRRRPPSGAAPGHMVLPPDAPKPVIRVMAYGPDRVDEFEVEDAGDLRALTESPRGVLWIDVEGFGDREVLTQIGEVLGIHALAMADVVHVPQRPKAELYGARLLVVSQMARLGEAGEVLLEQLSLVLGPGWVATFQERPGDVFDPLRERIRSGITRVRQAGPDYLAYSLLDAVIDGYFPVVEALGGVVDALEEEVVERASPATLARIHATRRTLLTLHRIQWRQRDALSAILRDEELPIADSVKPYFRDAYDHAFQILDAIETYRDMMVGLMDLHLSTSSNRINEVMKTLTIVATIFIPLTFVAGVYGMNFDHMPELHWRWGYPAIWGLMGVLGASLLLWFRGRGWIGGGAEESAD
ncbi:MAG TPA: magnesium/cobalt transporter CorA [Myxococcota bacterium]